MATAEEIRFYRASERPWGAFSNLFRREIEFEGELFPTSEHAYQAGKARKPEVRAWLMSAPSPALLAMAAHGLYTWDVTPGWSRFKFDRMRGVLRAKFKQHDDLRHLLLSTGNARLVEAATVDNPVNRLWGEVNGVGKNMLGELLMELRRELQDIGCRQTRQQRTGRNSEASVPLVAAE
ncbi:NADAR family protein [uncultured Methylobacterium sp.]|uniref:NADAR family protein n=1 Tax=uncultured Methylobacterium sp. TaxID=157278 RepID=UPI0035CC498F